MAWHQKAGVNLLLRAAGTALLVVAYLCGAALRARALAGPLNKDALAYLLAAMTFLGWTGGFALLTLGNHIFDQIEIAQRWHRIDRESRSDRKNDA